MKSPLLTAIFLVVVSTISYSQDRMVYCLKYGRMVVGDTVSIKVKDGYNLFVENGVLTEKLKVALRNTSEWSDDAFTNKPNIEAVEAHIREKSHLLDMPSATALVKEGYEVTNMDAKLLRQIEWLWIEMIAAKKENAALQAELTAIRSRLSKLEE